MFFCTFILLLSQCLAENVENFNEISNPESFNLNQNQSKLLIILVDGFRWDYVSILNSSLKGFPRIQRNGVSAQYVKPIFPENSYPNWYSIVTGLYAESHGIIQNHMYDNETNDMFLMGPHPNVSHPHWWTQVDPLWITAEQRGIKTAMYLWDGCQVSFNGTKPSFCKKYESFIGFDLVNNITRGNLKDALNRFSNSGYRLSLVYHDFVDTLGHLFGPLTENTNKAVVQIDNILYDLYDSITEQKLEEELNVVIVSDHGMTSLKGFQIINIKDYIDLNDIQLFLDGGSGAQILPKPGKEDRIFEQLSKVKGMTVYKREDIPESLHYKHNRLVLPLLLIADLGYDIQNNGNKESELGGHGYSVDKVPDMRAIMYGFGPAFKKNFISGPIGQVDHYNLFCHLLGITPNPNNGTYAKVEGFLQK